MATEKTFKIVGISKHPELGYKVRFANDIMRIKNLAKSGHEDIRLAELDTATSKLEGARQILTLEDFADATAQSTITEYLEDNTPKTTAPKAKMPAKAVKAMTKAKTAKVTEDEDAPF
jgi:hypothetical protein